MTTTATHPADLTGSPADRTDSARPMRGAFADSIGSSCAPVITVCLDPATDTPYRRYGLTQLLRVMRVSPIWTDENAPAVYYGADPAVGHQAAIWICPQRADSQDGRGWGVFSIDGVPVVCRGAPPQRLWDENRLTFDAASATAFWLCLDSEQHVSERDAHGRMPGAASLVPSSGAERPPVHVYADVLLRRLSQAGIVTDTGAFWPNRKRYAVALTHDVDLPERLSRTPGLIRDLVLGRRRDRRRTYWDLRSQMRLRGAWESTIAPPTARREWDFERYCELERSLGLRSTFFFAVVPRGAGHERDVTYDASRRRYRSLFRSLAAGGWEVGVQASYLTGSDAVLIRSQAGRLAQLAGFGAAGVRHHYLRLDCDDPMRSLARHADAGLLYDTTVGFNDCPGFRAGVALPYQLFDRDAGAVRPFVELPMTLADMHLPRDDSTKAVAMILDHLETVRSLGGLAVLNCHVGHWESDPAWRAAYCAACRHIAEDDSVWVAPAGDIARWYLSAHAEATIP